jgi:hypothetical protein
MLQKRGKLMSPQYIVQLEWFESDEEGKLLQEKFFGPFSSHLEAAEFGEQYLQTEQTSHQLDCSVGWTVATLFEPKLEGEL